MNIKLMLNDGIVFFFCKDIYIYIVLWVSDHMILRMRYAKFEEYKWPSLMNWPNMLANWVQESGAGTTKKLFF